MLLKKQNDVSLQRGMPVDPVSDSQKVVSQSEASVAFYYYNSGVLTADAGQAAGVNVVAKLTYAGILTSIGDVIGTNNDHSLAFTSTALTTEKEINFDVLENSDLSSGVNKLNAIVDGFANGEYCIDYRTGTIYGKKATTQTALTTVSYKTSTTAANVTLEASDIEIGAVEIKDATSDNRVVVDATGALKVTGGASSVTADYKSPADFTATYTSSSTITLTGVPFTIASGVQVAYVKVRNTSTNINLTYVGGANACSLGYSAGVITIYVAGVAVTTLTANDMYEVGVNAQIKTYDPILDTEKSVEQAPLNQQFVSESIIDTTNVAAATNYYPSALGMSMDGFKDMSITGKSINGSGNTFALTIEATNDEDQTNADWIAIYFYDTKNNSMVNTITNAASLTLTFAIDFDNLNYRYYRLAIVTVTGGSASNTQIIKMRRKAL